MSSVSRVGHGETIKVVMLPFYPRRPDSFSPFLLPHRPWIFTYSGLPYTAFRSPPPTVYSSPSWLPTPSAVPPVATPFAGIFAWKFRFDPLSPERPPSTYTAGSPLPATAAAVDFAIFWQVDCRLPIVADAPLSDLRPESFPDNYRQPATRLRSPSHRQLRK